MSTVDRYANAIRSGDKDALYNCIQEIGRQLDAINASVGGVQAKKVDDPGKSAKPIAVPPLVAFTITGGGGSFRISIANPQQQLASTPTQKSVQLAHPVNSANVMLYHQLQSAADQTFTANSSLVDYGVSPQTSFTVPNSGKNTYWRVRSSYDQRSWNSWQILKGSEAGTVSTYGGLPATTVTSGQSPSSNSSTAILHGGVDPLPWDGNDGDYYLNSASAILYGPKTNGAWPMPGVKLLPIGQVNLQNAGDYSVQQSDYGNLVVMDNAAPSTLTLDSTLAQPMYLAVQNLGAGVVTLQPSAGNLNGAASAELRTGGLAFCYFDGASWWAPIVPVLAQSRGTTAHQWLVNYDQTTGLFGSSQPAAADLSDGTVGYGPVVLESAAIATPGRLRFALWQSGRKYEAGAMYPWLYVLNDSVGIGGDTTIVCNNPTATEDFETQATITGIGKFIYLDGRTIFSGGKSGHFEARVRGINTVDNVRIWAALTDNSGLYNGSAFGRLIGFTYDIGTGVNGWTGVVSNGAGVRGVATNIVPSTARSSLLQVDWTPAGATFRIDGVVIGSVDGTCLPEAGNLMKLYFSIMNISGALVSARGAAVQFLYGEVSSS